MYLSTISDDPDRHRRSKRIKNFSMITRPIVRPLSPHVLSGCTRHSSSLPSRLRFGPLSIRRLPRERLVQKTKPLPLSPSPVRRRRRILLYLTAFFVSAGTTYSVLRPDNHVNHFGQGVVRCGRVGWTLARCVYDYRVTMRDARDMSECHLRCAQRTLRVFEKNGGIYIKLGQHLAALSYLIPIVLPMTMALTGRNGCRRWWSYKMHVRRHPWTN
jgi:hypothetical protein